MVAGPKQTAPLTMSSAAIFAIVCCLKVISEFRSGKPIAGTDFTHSQFVWSEAVENKMGRFKTVNIKKFFCDIITADLLNYG